MVLTAARRGSCTVNEMVVMVDIALGEAPRAHCRAGGADGSGDISVDEIIAAVNNDLGSCPE